MYLEERVEELEGLIRALAEEMDYLKAQKSEEYLTPEEFAEKTQINRNTVYCWIRENKIEILPGLGKVKRIPMSQFYKNGAEKEFLDAKMEKRNGDKAGDLKTQFLNMKRLSRRGL